MNNLTINDIDLLQESLDALECQESRSRFTKGVMGDIMEAMLFFKEDKANPEIQKRLSEKKEEEERREIEAEQQQKILKEKIILLKAKLIQMKDTD